MLAMFSAQCEVPRRPLEVHTPRFKRSDFMPLLCISLTSWGTSLKSAYLTSLLAHGTGDVIFLLMAEPSKVAEMPDL